MTEARRAVCSWLLTVLLERGMDPVSERRRHGEPARAELILDPEACRERLGPYSRVRFFPPPRPRFTGGT